MSNVKIVLNTAGVGELLKGAEVERMVSEIGENIARRSGTEYGSRVHNTGQRKIANVYPTTRHAFYSNLKHNTLLKNLY